MAHGSSKLSCSVIVKVWVTTGSLGVAGAAEVGRGVAEGLASTGDDEVGVAEIDDEVGVGSAGPEQAANSPVSADAVATRMALMR